MAAYAAVVSLHHAISALLLNLNSRVSSSSRAIFLEFAYKEASSLLQVLEALNGSSRGRSSMERVDVLEGQIRDCAHKLEDVLESHELKQQLEEKAKEDGDDERVMRQEIRCFGETAKRLRKEYLAELSRDDDDDNDEDAAAGSSDIDFGVEMIGRSRLFDNILKQDVVYRMRPDDRGVFVFLGEQGTGSRVVVETIFENAREAGKFERWGWARGHDEVKDVLMSLIIQVEPDHVDDDDEMLNTDDSEDRLSEYLYKALENRSYMIVLDGVDDVELLDYLLMKSFPDQGNGSVVLVTTISQEVVRSADFSYDYAMTVKVYEEDYWLHTRQIFFGRDSFPAELEVAGKEIFHNTGLLPITLAKTLVFLSKSDKTVEQWSKLAADKDNPIFTIANEISERTEIQTDIEYCKTDVAERVGEIVDFSPHVELCE